MVEVRRLSWNRMSFVMRESSKLSGISVLAKRTLYFELPFPQTQLTITNCLLEECTGLTF